MLDWIRNRNYSGMHDGFGVKDIDKLLATLCIRLQNSTLRSETCDVNDQNVSLILSDDRKLAGDGEDHFYSALGVGLVHQVILSVLYSLIMGTALLGNGVVLMTVACKKSLWKPMYIFITSLAVSDILVCLSCVPVNIILAVYTEWRLGSIICKSLPFFMQLGNNCSMLTLSCMAAERFVAIVHPLKFNAVHTVGKTLLLLLLVWLIAIATAAPFALYYELDELCGRYYQSGECEKLHKICLASKNSDVNKIHWLSFATLFILPALVMLVAYSIIIYNLWMKRQSGTMLSISSQRTNLKKKAVKMLVLVVLLYVMCWSPLQVFTLIIREDDNIKTSQVIGIKYYLECLAFSSTAYNPIVYAFLNQSFRNNFLTVMSRKWRRVSPMSTARGGLAPVRADAFKTGSSNFGAGKGTQIGSKDENDQASKPSKTTVI